MMTFDPTISWGALLNASVLFVGFIVAFTRIGERLKRVEQAIEKLSDSNTRIAILEERVTNHGKMIATNQAIIEDLRHCKGLINNPRQGVDG